MTTFDAEWTPFDRGLWFARQTERGLTCADCGHPRDESMADENLGPVPDYHAESFRCRACHAKSVAHAAMTERGDIDPLAGVKFAVTRNGTS